MRSDRPRPVAIVGGGYSGTMVAAELARRGIASLLIEGGGRAGRGTAFSTDEPAHLLNVRAEAMSAWADSPGDFSQAFAATGGDARGFAERRQFGRYLRAILDEALASGSVDLHSDTAVEALPKADGWTIRLAGGDSIPASALVLAIGNQPPEPLPFPPSARLINNPWSADAKAAVADLAARDAPVLIIGTGLTMVDMVLSLDAAGYRGRIVALSRRGLIPRAHADFTPAPVERDEVPHGHVRALWRWLRQRGATVGWRAAVDSLRPHSHALWASFDGVERRRFLRHARPWWDVHRHRIAPEVAQRLRELVADGQLEIVAGRIAGVRDDGDSLTVTVRRRRGTVEEQRFAAAFNCTGPLGRIERTGDALLRGMLDGRLARPDALGMGIAVDARSRVEGAPLAWAMGPLAKGRFWEIVAVPDIRLQAAAVADDIARELSDAART